MSFLRSIILTVLRIDALLRRIATEEVSGRVPCFVYSLYCSYVVMLGVILQSNLNSFLSKKHNYAYMSSESQQKHNIFFSFKKRINRIFRPEKGI